MYKIIFVSIFFIVSCNSNKTKEKSAETDSVKIESMHEKEKEEHEQHTSLILNGDKKWKLDEATKKNAGHLKDIVNNEKDPALLASSLTAGIDTLVGQCKMQGPGHDALHTWLQGFIGDVKKLKEAGNESQGNHVNKLKEDIDTFYQYFE